MVFQSEGSDKEGGDEVGEGRVGPGDFEIMRVVGKGAFGKVFQVRKKGGPEISGDSDGIFAMKVMRKDTIISKNHMDYMKAERDILIKVEHPFIVSLRCSFQVIVTLLEFDFFCVHLLLSYCEELLFWSIRYSIYLACKGLVCFRKIGKVDCIYHY